MALVLAWGAGLGVACSGGGGGGSGGGVLLSSLRLSVLDQSPLSAERQVPTNARIRIDFDGAIVADSLLYSDSGLFRTDATPIPGTFTVDSEGSRVYFTPQSPLPAETELEFKLSPLTADASGRLLDRSFAFSFHTEDIRPPTVAASTVIQGQAGVSRTAAIDITFDEAIEAGSANLSSVRLSETGGSDQSISISVAGAVLQVTPVADLAGSTNYSLEIDGGALGVADLAGNRLASSWSVSFTTAADLIAPLSTAGWPTGAPAASPVVAPCLYFDESIDPDSIGSASIQFVDSLANTVTFTSRLSSDLETVQLVPQSRLTAGETYTLTAVTGANALLDRSGNALGQLRSISFSVGTDDVGPSFASAIPATGTGSVARNVQPVIVFDEALDPASVTAATVELRDENGGVTATATLENANTTIRVTPGQLLTAGTQHTLHVRGGPWGVRDVAGNPLPSDVSMVFSTTDDDTLPTALLFPNDRNSSVPTSASVVAVFDAPLDPVSVHSGTAYVSGPGGIVAGTLTLTRSDRVIRFQPSAPWSPGTWYTWTILGGENGIREATGNFMAADASSQFRTSFGADLVSPTVSVTINGVDSARNANLSVPPSGFAFEISGWDPLDYSLDMSTVELQLAGVGAVPGAESIFATTSLTPTTADYTLDPSWTLVPGDYTAVARVRDLSGNLATSQPLSFQVRDLDAGSVPFEKTQIIWVRFDLDRDGNGREDLLDDLLRLGLATAGDPAGTNARMLQVMRDGIIARTHALFGRAASGEALDPNAVSIRLADSRPLGLDHAEMACGGLDPEGNSNRVYGDLSSGTLGRAWFDYQNGRMTESNTGSRPGLGVFPSELFLFEARIHQQIYPTFLTSFGRRFLPICPDMGGTPAGSDPLDATVLSPTFVYSSATTSEQVRYTEVFSAADDWATAVGTVLAHEIGHSVGLVADGPNPRGLHGDGSLHNEFAGSSDVMASALGYDSLIFLNYGFRDLNIAYLRHRILLK